MKLREEIHEKSAKNLKSKIQEMNVSTKVSNENEFIANQL